MNDEVWAPGAQLMESMRAVGYSFKTAIADVVDNSITANATEIDIGINTTDFFVTIFDNGDGMDRDEAREAMQLAGKSAAFVRGSSDLGRFGLGLKTASLSQCRKLTIVTQKAGKLTGLVWDLDHVALTNEWRLIVLEERQIADVPGFARFSSSESGTLVVWEKFDRLTNDDKSRARELDQSVVESRDHLSLVFHRFLSGEAGVPNLVIRTNGRKVEPADPFLAGARGAQSSVVESIDVQGHKIDVKSFTLPFMNSMSTAQRKRALVAGSLRDSQGFYIYRAYRLVIWGTWFRLVPKQDSAKLTRVRVDVPNSLDHLWSLDIKKSSAVPPPEIRERLKILAGAMMEPSTKAISYRGRKTTDNDDLVRTWDLVEDRDEFRYRLNRAHPMFRTLSDLLDAVGMRELENALRVIETTFPSQDLYNRMSNDLVPVQNSADLQIWRDVLRDMWRQAQPTKRTATEFIDQMIGIEPMDQLKWEKDSLVKWIQTDQEEATS